MSYIYPEYLMLNPLKMISMKNKKILWTALPFLGGALFGISLLGLFSFCSSGPGSNEPVVTKISSADAHTFYQNYIRTASPYTGKLSGFTVDKAELTVMNTILGVAPSAAAFRFYFGTDASGTGIMIVCGVDANGADMTGNVYSATKNKVGPCPPLCDINSPIPGQQ
jgi:hypothetical protein